MRDFLTCFGLCAVGIILYIVVTFLGSHLGYKIANHGEDPSNVYIKVSNALYVKRLTPGAYGETEFDYDPVNAISVRDSFATFFTDDAVVTPLPNSFLTLK